MRVIALFAAALAPLAAAQVSVGTTSAFANATTTVTTVLTAFTTFCPEPTVVTLFGNCYTITEPTTLTITDCPCTLTTAVPVAPTMVPPPGTGLPIMPTFMPTGVVVSGAAGRQSVMALAVAIGGAALGLVAM